MNEEIEALVSGFEEAYQHTIKNGKFLPNDPYVMRRCVFVCIANAIAAAQADNRVLANEIIKLRKVKDEQGRTT